MSVKPGPGPVLDLVSVRDAAHKSVHSRIDSFGSSGRKSLALRLSQATDPFATISAVHNELGLQHEKSQVLLNFTDSCEIPRGPLYLGVLVGMRAKLEAVIESLDHASLLTMLRETLSFIAHPELRSVPLAVLKKMPTDCVPASSLLALARRGLLQVCVCVCLCVCIYTYMYILCVYVCTSLCVCVSR